MRCFAIAIACLIVAGCATQHQRGIVFEYPAGMETICSQAVEESRQRIASCGTELQACGSYRIRERLCTEQVGGVWCWTDAAGRCVGGLTSGKKNRSALTLIGVGPTREPDWGCLVHEAAHYWLITNFGDATHNPTYDDVLFWENQR
jgi:hypothetical protein